MVAGENMALRSMPTLGLATEALLNRLAHCRGFGLAEARSEIMRRRTNMQSLSPRLQKTKGVDVCGLKRCGRFRGGRSSRGYESPVCQCSLESVREGSTTEAFPEPQALRGSRLVLGPVGATDLLATVENVSLTQDLGSMSH